MSQFPFPFSLQGAPGFHFFFLWKQAKHTRRLVTTLATAAKAAIAVTAVNCMGLEDWTTSLMKRNKTLADSDSVHAKGPFTGTRLTIWPVLAKTMRTMTTTTTCICLTRKTKKRDWGRALYSFKPSKRPSPRYCRHAKIRLVPHGPCQPWNDLFLKKQALSSLLMSLKRITPIQECSIDEAKLDIELNK